VPVKTESKTDLYRKLPSVDEVLRDPQLVSLVSLEGRASVTDAARAVLAGVRDAIASGRIDAAGMDFAITGIKAAVERQLKNSLSYSLRAVINATGVILHTNLGRAPILSAALDHISATATRYSNLEFDLSAGERGKRDAHIDRLFRVLLNNSSLTGQGAEPPEISTIVVNNNAAAVLLALNTLAEGGEVIVSRGELVEIGGSFRIPDVMAKSNAFLREVGTTNRTKIGDYERAINDKTRLLLRVHRSNFEITGFTEQPRLEELVSLARKRNLPLMEDLGSGALVELDSFGLSGEPSVLDSLRAGVDVVTYSGDKLLGGPQAGILSGRADLIGRTRSSSLFRALRVDKLIYSALEATLMAYTKHDYDSIPTLRMMRMSKGEIASRAEAIAGKIAGSDLQAELIDGESVVGGGAAPSAVLPTCLLAIRSSRLSADELSTHLRANDPAIIARVDEGRVVLDLRTVFPEQDELIAESLNKIGD